MTVIAWDGKTLAADKRATNGWCAPDTVTKIQRYRADVMIATTGLSWKSRALLEWWKAGASPSAFPHETAKDDDAGNLIVITNNEGRVSIQQWSSGAYPSVIEDRYRAWGSGTDLALAAMYCGRDARSAVEVACHFSPSCGNGVDTLEFDAIPVTSSSAAAAILPAPAR